MEAIIQQEKAAYLRRQVMERNEQNGAVNRSDQEQSVSFDASVEPGAGPGADPSSCGCRAGSVKRAEALNRLLAALVLAAGLRRRASRSRGAGAA